MNEEIKALLEMEELSSGRLGAFSSLCAEIRRLNHERESLPCPQIMALATDMQFKLDKNERKPCPHMQLAPGEKRTWEQCDLKWLITRMEDEIVELKEEMDKGDIAEARLECADIANFAMMFHDKLRGF